MKTLAPDADGPSLEITGVSAARPSAAYPAARVAARASLGLLLLATAGMKADVFVEGSSPAFAVFGSLRMQVAAIASSAVLGVWLLSGKSVRPASTLAVGYFSLLAGASFAMGVQERPTCGCFGSLPVNPWLAFGTDVAALAILFALPPAGGWPRLSGGLLGGRVLPLAGFSFFGASTVLAASATVAGFGSPAALFWYLRDEPVSAVHDDTVHTGEAGEERLIPVTLLNRGPLPVTIYGGTRVCGLESTGDLPLTIPPGETRSPRVLVYFGGGLGVTYRNGLFYTDAGRQPQVNFWVTLRILEQGK